MDISDQHLRDTCNMAAYALGFNPQPVRDLISKFVAEDAKIHSSQIPQDQREEFLDQLAALVESQRV